MTMQTRAAGKAAVIASIYTNAAKEVSGNEVQAAINNLADSAIIQEAWEDIASAATCAIGGTSSNFVNITGTTTITSFGTIGAGVLRFVKFAGALTLTHNGTSLILIGGANIVTAAGDVGLFVSEGSGNWRQLDFRRAAGSYIESLVSGAEEVALTSGVQTNVTSISLPPGDWDVSGVVYHHPAGTTSYTRHVGSISLISATIDSAAGRFVDFPQAAYVSGGLTFNDTLPPTRISVAATTTVYLVALGVFSVSTSAAYGRLRARRAAP